LVDNPKILLSGQQPCGQSVDAIKGWMTLADITKAYNVSLADILAEFELPTDTPETEQLKNLENERFLVTNLPAWLSARQQHSLEPTVVVDASLRRRGLLARVRLLRTSLPGGLF
jgi:hypothetical protein